jgi:hypothetical protein
VDSVRERAQADELYSLISLSQSANRVSHTGTQAWIRRKRFCWPEIGVRPDREAEAADHRGTLTTDEGEPVNTRIRAEPGDYMHGNATVEVTPLQAWRTLRVLEMALQPQRGSVSATGVLNLNYRGGLLAGVSGLPSTL